MRNGDHEAPKQGDSFRSEEDRFLFSVIKRRISDRGGKEKYQRRFIDVLSAAANQFAEKGFTGASIQNIAEELGLRQGAIYYYLPSKEKALELICDVAIDGYVEFSSEILMSENSTESKIDHLVGCHLATLRHRPSFFKVFQSHRKELEINARHQIGKKIRNYEYNVEKIILEGVKSKQLKPYINPKLSMLLLLSMCNSVVIWGDKRNIEEIEIIRKSIVDTILDGWR